MLADRKDAVHRDTTEPGQRLTDAWSAVLDALENLRGAAEHLTNAQLLTLHPVYVSSNRSNALANFRYRLTHPYTMLAAIADEMDQWSRLSADEGPGTERPQRSDGLTTEQQREWARKFQEQISDLTEEPG